MAGNKRLLQMWQHISVHCAMAFNYQTVTLPDYDHIADDSGPYGHSGRAAQSAMPSCVHAVNNEINQRVAQQCVEGNLALESMAAQVGHAAYVLQPLHASLPWRRDIRTRINSQPYQCQTETISLIGLACATISCDGFGDNDFRESFRILPELGFRYIEFNAWYPSAITPAKMVDLKQRCAARGILPACIHGDELRRATAPRN